MSLLELRHLPVPDVAGMDPRRGRRFSLSLSCSCMSPSAEFAPLAGKTCNMSRTGVLARFNRPGASEVLPKVGETALLEIDLPTSPNFSPRFLQCMAIVVRVLDEGNENLSVAFELRRIRVEDRHKKTPAPCREHWV